jgi:hypothetical protein
MSPEVLSLMISKWKLTPVNRNDGIVPLFWRDLPNKLSSASQGSAIQFYRTAEWTKGDLYIVMNDKTHKRLIVRYYYNW